MRNPYKMLRDLLPEPPLQIGDVISVLNGVATISSPGGGLSTARGAATVGQRVFFRDSNIEGQAPALPVEIIEV